MCVQVCLFADKIEQFFYLEGFYFVICLLLLCQHLGANEKKDKIKETKYMNTVNSHDNGQNNCSSEQCKTIQKPALVLLIKRFDNTTHERKCNQKQGHHSDLSVCCSVEGGE